MSDSKDLKCVVIDILDQAESDGIGWKRNPENEIHEELEGLVRALTTKVKGDADRIANDNIRIKNLQHKLGQAVEQIR